MRAWVFGETQIEPALQRWFGRLPGVDPQEEQYLHNRIVEFLTSDAAASLRFTQHDPQPAAARTSTSAGG